MVDHDSNAAEYEDMFKGNTKKIEMSRYIDLDIYHAVERSHPYYEEMVAEIIGYLGEYGANDRPMKMWEFGAGTGLFTQDLITFEQAQIDALDLDQDCVEILRSHIEPKAGSRVRCICGDALAYKGEDVYDVIASTFAHDHIHYDKAGDLVASIRRNLKPDGIYVMGMEILPYFETDEERCDSLYRYHGFIVEKALREENFELAQIEISALKSGIYSIGDFKRHEAQFEDEMTSRGFKIVQKTKLGPDHDDTIGGVYSYAFQLA